MQNMFQLAILNIFCVHQNVDYLDSFHMTPTSRNQRLSPAKGEGTALHNSLADSNFHTHHTHTHTPMVNLQTQT